MTEIEIADIITIKFYVPFTFLNPLHALKQLKFVNFITPCKIWNISLFQENHSDWIGIVQLNRDDKL